MSSAKDDKVQVTFRGVSLANEDFNFVPQPYFAVNPRTTSYRLWEAVSAICIFLTCLLVPYQASFESRDATLWVFVYIFDVLFLADVLLKFRVGYFNKGTLVTDKSLVSRRYLRTKFVPDLLTLIPLDLLVFGVQTHLEWHQLLTLVRLNRILRVYRLASFFGRSFRILPKWWLMDCKFFNLVVSQTNNFSQTLWWLKPKTNLYQHDQCYNFSCIYEMSRVSVLNIFLKERVRTDRCCWTRRISPGYYKQPKYPN